MHTDSFLHLKVPRQYDWLRLCRCYKNLCPQRAPGGALRGVVCVWGGVGGGLWRESAPFEFRGFREKGVFEFWRFRGGRF